MGFPRYPVAASTSAASNDLYDMYSYDPPSTVRKRLAGNASRWHPTVSNHEHKSCDVEAWF